MALSGFGYYIVDGITNPLPRAARNALGRAQEVVLYSLFPYPAEIKGDKFVPVADDTPQFHGYPILGQISLASGDTREAAVDAVNEAVNTMARRRIKSTKACFRPRHGMRVIHASRTYDLIICFQCYQMIVHSPGGSKRYVGIDGTGAELNRILEEAKVPLPTN